MVDYVENESNKGDARAAALAALHPMAYDPDNRVQYMAGWPLQERQCPRPRCWILPQR
ncbi:MAG: hypothetical protein ACLRZ2_01895 [Veillonella sp.]